MPDAPEAPVEPEAPETVAPEDTPADSPDEPEKPKPTETVDFWKAKAREQEKRAKENDRGSQKACRRWKTPQKSELQKWQERAESAEGAISAIQAAQEIRDAKDAISKQYGVPADVLARLRPRRDRGTRSKSLKALLPEPRKPGPSARRGAHRHSPETGDPAQQFAELIRNARK
jgi:hypothetical protein